MGMDSLFPKMSSINVFPVEKGQHSYGHRQIESTAQVRQKLEGQGK
jgi:hypothetical protein